MATKKTAKKTKKNDGSGKFFLGAALGAIAGGITGILTAPKSGKQTRADIEREGKKFAKKVQKEGKKIGSKVETEIKKATSGKTAKKNSAKKTRK